MINLLELLLSALAVGLLLHYTLHPYRNELPGSGTKQVYKITSTIFNPVFRLFRTFLRPIPVGYGKQIDFTGTLLMIIIVILLSL